MTNLYIFATEKDLSVQSIAQEADKQGFRSQVKYYEDLKISKGELKENESVITLQDSDRVLIRWPWDASNTEVEYNDIVRYLCERYPKKIVLDFKCLKNFTPQYEDKYFQYQLFKRCVVSTPDVYLIKEQNKAENTFGYPMVIKKRISSRSKSNYLIENKQQLEIFKTKINPDEYLLQAKIRAVKDLRVLMLKGQLIGVVSRLMHVRGENRLSVKGMELVNNVDNNIIRDANKLATALGGDLIGLDVLVEESGKYYFIEANLSPQFVTFMQVTGINVSSKIIEAIFGTNSTIKP